MPMSPVLRSFVGALLVAAAACAPRVPDGALTPRPERTTNEARLVDLQVFDAWNERILTLMTSPPGEAADARRVVAALAAADAWLAFARDEYVREPRSIVVDEALAHARAMVEALERGAPLEVSPRLVTGTARVHEELWAGFEAVRARDAEPALLAESAVLLVRAGRVPAPGETTVCDPAPFVARLRDNLAILAATTRPRIPAVVVEATPTSRKEVAIRSVFFALDSDTISRAGREMLDGLVSSLEGHHGVTIELRGFADPRGSAAYNVALARRRATAVQQYLAARTLAITTFDIRPVGRARAAADLSDLTGLARDRRVDLRVVLPDGTEATRAESLEADLQVEARRRASRRP